MNADWIRFTEAASEAWVRNRWFFYGALVGATLLLLSIPSQAQTGLIPNRSILQVPPPTSSTTLYDSSDTALAVWSLWTNPDGTTTPLRSFGVTYRGTLMLSFESFVPETPHLMPAGSRLGFLRVEVGSLSFLIPLYEDLLR